MFPTVSQFRDSAEDAEKDRGSYVLVNYLPLKPPDTFCMPPWLTYNVHEILFR